MEVCPHQSTVMFAAGDGPWWHTYCWLEAPLDTPLASLVKAASGVRDEPVYAAVCSTSTATSASTSTLCNSVHTIAHVVRRDIAAPEQSHTQEDTGDSALEVRSIDPDSEGDTNAVRSALLEIFALEIRHGSDVFASDDAMQQREVEHFLADYANATLVARDCESGKTVALVVLADSVQRPFGPGSKSVSSSREEETDSDATSNSAAHLSFLWVAPTHYRRGLASRLFQAALRRVKSDILYSSFVAENTVSSAWHKAQGFAPYVDIVRVGSDNACVCHS